MTYDWNDSGKPPRYNVLLNELPNGNNPSLNYENKMISKDKKKTLLEEIFPSFNLARISLCRICTCKRA